MMFHTEINRSGVSVSVNLEDPEELVLTEDEAKGIEGRLEEFIKTQIMPFRVSLFPDRGYRGYPIE
jgi:hypothetical protein